MHQKPLRSSSEPLIAIVKSADLRKGDDPTLIRRPYKARLWAILFEGEVGPGVVIVPQVGRQKPPEVVFTQDNDGMRQSRRIGPMTRSAKAFCQGERGALNTSVISMAFSRDRNAAP